MTTEIPTVQVQRELLDRLVRNDAQAAVARIIDFLDVPKGDGIVDTPRRVIDALVEMTSGYKVDIASILGTVFEEPFADEMIVLRDIEFVSLCEHHLLPFVGVAHVGYVPQRSALSSDTYSVVGLSKLARLVDAYARRLQVQERMTQQIATALEDHLGARGVGVIVKATHSCMAVRGVKKSGASMVTSTMLGVMRDIAARAEFLRLVS